MWTHVVAVLGLGALCGVWILVQRLVERHVPGRGPTHDGCDSCDGCDGCVEEGETTGKRLDSR